MANMARLNKIQRRIVFAAAIILLAVSLFITVAPGLDLPFKVPSWDDIFSAAGMTESDEALQMPFTAHYIDVGQGDCELIKCGGFAMLIDSGESGNAETILSYLEKQGVTALDYIVITHPHSDHMGSMSEIIKRLPPKCIIMPQLSGENIPTTKVYENLLLSIRDSGAQVIAAKAGESYTLGDSEFTVLSPSRQYDDLNNMSVVLHFVYGSSSFLFTGDAETEAEKDILKSGFDMTSDVLKVGHHGSDTSSSEKFIKSVKPLYAVISCGAGNSYNHPHAKIVNRISSLGIEILRTDVSGTIVIGSDGKEYKTLKGA
ncbi:MAG: MBL fold metallo-hydrolase [Clostridiales bacterium]|nr:MBL fold metallo-hydrolase [Clostridiales bacterium]